ncbi:sigma-54-dependent Fis family transcriptional regulator [bacterium]|nr:sigma-54-dependent Fis family transcriptional regulator [candidate division CSSED10-310 bacterium]
MKDSNFPVNEVPSGSTSLKPYHDAVFHGMIGDSDVMLSVYEKIKHYAPTDAPVIVSGETGTGKELVARALHYLSNRKTKPFVAVNCTALNEDLFESELFGHEKGAFTGALKMHKGRFERADSGTLFLDEIGDMHPRTQAKLLRVLEENRIERVGGEVPIPVNVRLICATNISLELAVTHGRFRADLYHRLAVLRIHVPPLRDRNDDLMLLVNYFLEILNRRYGKYIKRLTPDALRALKRYHWPGNVRELRNVIERIYVETQDTVIGRNAFREWERERDYLAAGQWDLHHYESQRLRKPPFVPPYPESNDQQDDYQNGRPYPYIYPQHYVRRLTRALPSGREMGREPVWVEGEFKVSDIPKTKPKQLTPETLKKAYRDANGNITQAAKKLGMHKATFYRYLKKFNLTRDQLEG